VGWSTVAVGVRWYVVAVVSERKVVESDTTKKRIQ
jgi:hypothetical protein